VQRDFAGVDPDVRAADVDRHQIGFSFLGGVGVGQFEQFPSEVVVNDRAGRDDQIEGVGYQAMLNRGEVTRVARPQPAMP